MSGNDTEARIRARAYEIWERDCPELYKLICLVSKTPILVYGRFHHLLVSGRR
jgi:hypothetical protein